jgi:putative component of membrane protein insertase Oxa1/YidC/SpoIIIJ protein YidD
MTQGALRGGAKAAWRILRCNPLFPGGYDPVCGQAHLDVEKKHDGRHR